MALELWRRDGGAWFLDTDLGDVVVGHRGATQDRRRQRLPRPAGGERSV